MNAVNINEFMDRFHALERELHLFDSVADGQLWWDSVRFDTCEFLFDCLSGLTNSSAHRSHRIRKLGKLRRSVLRQLLFARAQIDRKDLLVIRTPRSIVKNRLQDAVLDPITDLFPSRSLIINTLPRRYHLPDFEEPQSPGKIPSLQHLVGAFQNAFGLDSDHASSMKELIRRGRAEYACQVAGYHRLFDKARPRAVLLVQNGIEKALFHAAKVRGIPTVEAQHGLIGHGHPAYSYPLGIDYGKQTTLPDLFLTFSKFWQNAGFYPAQRQAVIGTDHFAVDFAPVDRPLGISLYKKE